MMSEVLQRGPTAERFDNGDTIGEWKPRWKMMFIWQCPIMFMSYSVLFFLAGLTIFVCTPLIRWNGWNTGSNVSVALWVRLLARDSLLKSPKVAVVYLATTVTAGGIFIFCSFWIYHYIDLEHGSGDMTELETEASALRYT